MTSEALALELTGPLDGPTPMLAAVADLGALDYVVEEYICSGTATGYDGEPTEDGQWTASSSSTAAFTTRFVVFRPASAGAFNGTVVVEWLNVSSGGDGPPDLMFLRRDITRSGMAWVGVSAQKVGIDGMGNGTSGTHLKKVAPERYAALDHPGDAYSYDMYTQVARAVRGDTGRSVLGDLVPERILAVGESQSAGFLVTYANAIDPLARVFDGFLIHGRGARGSLLAGFRLTRAEGVPPVTIETVREDARRQVPHRTRTDARVPVLTVQSETDVVTLVGHRGRQDDGDRTRLWEIAGTAHADVYLMAGRADDGTRSGEELAALFAPTTSLLGRTFDTPINTGAQQHYVVQAALVALDAWVRDGTPPASAPRLELTDDGHALVVDGDGIARGGIRTPWVDAPTCRLSGLGATGPGTAALFGVTEVWGADRLAQRYPGGRDEYLTAMRASLASAVDAGFLLAADAPEIDGLLAATYDLALRSGPSDEQERT